MSCSGLTYTMCSQAIVKDYLKLGGPFRTSYSERGTLMVAIDNRSLVVESRLTDRSKIANIMTWTMYVQDSRVQRAARHESNGDSRSLYNDASL